MGGSHDSITRARALERAGESHAALEGYRAALEAEEAAETGALHVRIGDLFLRTGAATRAAESFARAGELFVADGQGNNAIEAWRRVLEIEPDHREALEQLIVLALQKSYGQLAAELSTAALARAIDTGDRDRAFEVLTGYIARFPNEDGVWRAWADRLSGACSPEIVKTELKRAAAFLQGVGSADAAGAIEAELHALDPAPGRAEVVPEPGETLERADAGDPESRPDDDDLPLLGVAPEEGAGEELADAGPLPGLEPTHAEVVEPIAIEGLEGLLLDAGIDVPEGEDAGPPDDLPLLGSRPDEEEPAMRVEDTVETPPGAPGAEGPIRDVVRELERISGGRSVRPADPAAHYDLGRAYRAMGLPEEAAAQFAAALAGGHDPAAVAEEAGEALVAAGKADVAVRVLADILQLGEGGKGESFVGACYWLGRAFEMLGDMGDAHTAYRRAAAIDAGFGDVAERLRRSGGSSF